MGVDRREVERLVQEWESKWSKDLGGRPRKQGGGEVCGAEPGGGDVFLS